MGSRLAPHFAFSDDLGLAIGGAVAAPVMAAVTAVTMPRAGRRTVWRLSGAVADFDGVGLLRLRCCSCAGSHKQRRCRQRKDTKRSLHDSSPNN
jgi:hypothetical protein